MSVVLAVDPERRTNAQLVADLVTLGHLTDVPTLDTTYGHGRWWRRWRPTVLIGHDIDPTKAPDGAADFTALPYADAAWAQVTFDPPYKLNGTPTTAVDGPYGVDVVSSWQDRHRLIVDGLRECARVTAPGGVLVLKCQDQVCSGAVRWQTIEFAGAGAAVGLRLVDALYVSARRAQPSGRRQVHAHGRPSAALVFRR